MAVKKCCIENCKSCSTRKEDLGVTYHKFPKDVNFRQIWIKVTHNKHINIDFPSFVCSRHFRKSDFQTYKDSKYVLKSDAVPSIFPWTMADKTETVTMDTARESKEINEDVKDTTTSNSEGENLDAIRKFIAAQERDIQEQKLDKKCEEKESAESANDAKEGNEESIIINDETQEEQTLAVASSVMQMILSDSEARITEKKDVKVSKEHVNSGNLDKGNGSVALSVGSKVEAKDFGEFWHSAHIVEVDYDDMEVLVHYENDMKKHDEWISVSSPRLRPFGSPATKPSTPTEETLNIDASQPIKAKEEVTVKSEHIEDKLKYEEKTKLQFTIGERCLARWRDNRRFVATVHADLGNGHYEVIFDDGFRWKCTTTRMYKLKQSTKSGDGREMTSISPSISPIPYGAGPSTSVAEESSTAAINVPYHTHLFDPTRDYLGSKSERREMKRKLNIKEIFNIGQKRRKKPKSPKERLPKTHSVEGQLKVIKSKEVPKSKSSISSSLDVKKDIPDAIASIIGTKDMLDESKKKLDNEITSNATNVEATKSTDTDITKSIAVKTEAETGANLDILNLQDSKNDDDPVIKEERLENFEKQDDGKHEEVIDKIKEVINKLEDGISKVERMDSPKPPLKEAVVVKHEEPTDGMKVVLNKLDDKLLKSENIIIPKAQTDNVEIVKQDENVSNQSELNISDNDKPKKFSKMKKSKKLRLLQEKKVKKQVEKVKNELEEMKKQVEEMRKQMLMKTEAMSTTKKMEMPESFLLPGEWCCRWVNGQPLGEVSEMECEAKVDANNKPALPRRSVQVEDKRLPPGWTKHMVRRSLGHSAGKWDVVLVSPENRRFHTKTDMRNYLENNPNETLMNYEHALMDFGVHLKLSRRMGWVSDTPDGVERNPVVPTPPELLSNTSPLVKRRKLNLKKRSGKVKAVKQRLSQPMHMPQASSDASADAGPSASIDPSAFDSSLSSVDMSHNMPLEDGYVYVGSLKVQIIENLLRCPAEGCYKNFRNNTLLQMHIKHYHRELRKMMGATPKVLDLAYARTMPIETEVTKPKDDKTIKIKITRPPKRTEEPKQETKEAKTELPIDSLATTPMKSEEKTPKPQDSPKLRNALINKPVKRPKVLLPVRRIDPELVPKSPKEEIPEEKETMDSTFEDLFEPLDFETAISTHTVTKPALEKRKKEKKKCFATVSKRPTSEDDEWFGVNSDVDTRLSFPRSGTPDSRVTDSKMEILAQPMSSESNGEQKDNLYMYAENGERIKIVHMKREEIINCHCGFREEDGLMVQCELCLCWQHALCHNIQKESEVPEKYTCSICLNPRRGRRSQRFLHDQDRLYEGLLPGAKPDESLRRSHELSGNLLRIQDALHAIRVKYYVATKYIEPHAAGSMNVICIIMRRGLTRHVPYEIRPYSFGISKKDHPKLYLWAKDWENAELNLTQEKLNSDYSDLNIMINNIGKENLPMKPDMQLDIKSPSSEEQDAERFSERDHQLGSQSLLSGLLSSPGGASLELPISSADLEKLTSLQAGRGAAPQPEAAIEDGACRERLLRHLARCHALIDARLDSIEAQVAELESQDPSFEDDETADYFPRTKQTIQMLLRDLDTMEELGVIT